MRSSLLNLYNESGVDINTLSINKCAETIAAYECHSVHCEVNLLLCDDADMQKHNKTYRGHGAITDVLCFAAEKPAASCFESAQPELVCDIIIDINQIDRQKGHKTLDEELLDVFIHGLLHGFGYDHIRRQDQITMMEKEIYYKNMMEGT